ncbi:MAG: hypothetical protein AMXMBFR72_11430 [Betaproteobacteria bacterium]|jgi:GntR family phosphonate transport system transcriptional regulator
MTRTTSHREGTAACKRIAATLAAEIRDRVYTDGGRLPGESELARRFGVNRHTLRQALAELVRQGLLSIERGKGAFVRPDMVDYLLSRRTRFSENLLRQGLLPGKRLLAAREIAAPEKVAHALRLPRGAHVLRLEMLDEANEQPVALAVAHYPADRFAGLLELLDERCETTEMLRRLGVNDYVRATSRITTQMPTDELARLLQQPKTRPLLCVESVDADLAGVPIKYGETTFAGDRVQLVVGDDGG